MPYLDTSALVRRAELAAATPCPRSVRAGTPVATLLQGAGCLAATSEIGLVEFRDVVTTLWRDTMAANLEYDETWFETVWNQVMGDVAAGRLTVLYQPYRVLEQAMHLVTMATRDHGRKLRAWDAVHLITAVGWSVSTNSAVELWTTDTDYSVFTTLYPHFSSRITVRNLDT